MNSADAAGASTAAGMVEDVAGCMVFVLDDNVVPELATPGPMPAKLVVGKSGSGVIIVVGMDWASVVGAGASYHYIH